MAVADKKGRMHHSAGRAALQDDMDSRPSDGSKDAGYGSDKKDAGKKDAGTDAGKDGKETDVSNMEIGQVVKKHGPAHHIVIAHDDDNAMHTVTSHHGKPAHVHHSEHGSREQAQSHADMAAGMEADDQANETPSDEMNEEIEGNEQPANKIPGMANA